MYLYHHRLPPCRKSLSRFAAQFSSRSPSSSSPLQPLLRYCRMHRQSLPFDSFSILFALKSCTGLPLNVARHLHAHLLKLGFAAHVYVATSLLTVYSSSTVFSDACILFDEMPARNTVAWNVMITGFSRQHNIEAAQRVFNSMPARNLESWSAMIAAYMANQLWVHGLLLFRQMSFIEHECLYPDQLMLGSVLGGCGQMGSVGLMFGKSIHAFTIKNKWELNVQLGTCLIDMYTKCGLLRSACLIFSRMSGNNVVAMTALICGMAKHGLAQEALQLFDKMREVGVKPNEVTFTGILTACVQAGLVDEGRTYFRMLRDLGLSPNMQHYGCMVDLFGKAGLLREAYEVIKTMPYEANVVIWGSFLFACKLHREFELAEKVVDEVMASVRPENNGGVYSLICDVYVLRGKWGDAERIRKLMLNQNVKKVRGSSFIRSGGGTSQE